MSQNKHQNHKNHNCNGNCQHRKQERIGFGVPTVVQIEQRPAVTISLDEYEELIRVSERAEIVARYVAGSKYSPDKEMVLEILGVEEAEEGGETE